MKKTTSDKTLIPPKATTRRFPILDFSLAFLLCVCVEGGGGGWGGGRVINFTFDFFQVL